MVQNNAKLFRQQPKAATTFLEIWNDGIEQRKQKIDY